MINCDRSSLILRIEVKYEKIQSGKHLLIDMTKLEVQKLQTDLQLMQFGVCNDEIIVEEKLKTFFQIPLCWKQLKKVPNVSEEGTVRRRGTQTSETLQRSGFEPGLRLVFEAK